MNSYLSMNIMKLYEADKKPPENERLNNYQSSHKPGNSSYYQSAETFWLIGHWVTSLEGYCLSKLAPKGYVKSALTNFKINAWKNQSLPGQIYHIWCTDLAFLGTEKEGSSGSRRLPSSGPWEAGSCDVEQDCKTQILIHERRNVIKVTMMSQAMFVIKG